MSIPRHIAIIPDGNRRWAKKRGLPSFEGHRFAAEKILPSLIETSAKLGVEYFTFWVLSTENLAKRTQSEVNQLLNLMRLFIKRKLNEFKKKGVKIKIIGRTDTLPKDIGEGMKKVIEETRSNDKIMLIFAVNYGGRDEVVRAVKKVQSSKFKVQSLNEDNFNIYLDTYSIPDPDLVIRTGGEKRLSGFMPWQSVYSELYFTDLLFPDFAAKELKKAIEDYSSRQRRFGR